nr:MAG TPA: hypothetical protein [Caudoviricetes sp.]
MNDEEYRMFVERKPIGEELKTYLSVIRNVALGAIALSLFRYIKKGK